jgi:hypothetical protein
MALADCRGIALLRGSVELAQAGEWCHPRFFSTDTTPPINIARIFGVPPHMIGELDARLLTASRSSTLNS